MTLSELEKTYRLVLTGPEAPIRLELSRPLMRKVLDTAKILTDEDPEDWECIKFWGIHFIENKYLPEDCWHEVYRNRSVIHMGDGTVFTMPHLDTLSCR